MNRDLHKIYPLLKSMNLAHFQKRVELGEIFLVKVREIEKLKVKKNKNGLPTYLNEDKE